MRRRDAPAPGDYMPCPDCGSRDEVCAACERSIETSAMRYERERRLRELEDGSWATTAQP